MDLSRVGVTGWSFGGHFTAMATIRRPDIFKVGVAGAPVVDFADYDRPIPNATSPRRRERQKRSHALLANVKPYDLLLLPGTHLLPDPVLRQRVDESRAGFLARYLR